MPATIDHMPRPKKKPGESKKDTTEPVRVSRALMAIIRLVAPAAGLSAPEWIEARLAPIARKELDSVPDRVAELRKKLN